MKLTDLNPRFYFQGAYEWIAFDCPTCKDRPVGENEIQHSIDLPIDPTHLQKWDMRGREFATLSITPSILDIGACGVHFFVTNGEIIFC